MTFFTYSSLENYKDNLCLKQEEFSIKNEMKLVELNIN
jgi:hypothetical protein